MRGTEFTIPDEHQALVDELEVAPSRPQFLTLRAFTQNRLTRTLRDLRALYD